MWQRLYLSTNNERVTETLRGAVTDAGYTLYDPFAASPGKAYKTSLRFFVSPAHDGWVHVIPEGDVDDAFARALSTHGLCLSAILDENTDHLCTYQDGEVIDTADALLPHLREGYTAAQLRHALMHITPTDDHSTRQDKYIPTAALPDDVKQMASKLNPKHVNKMFDKLMKRVNKQFSGDADAAHELIAGDKPDWVSSGGQRIQEVMAYLDIHEWYQPEFVALRDAYQLHLRKQRKPDAPLYPGDAEMMEAVPDALDYIPVYGGR
jgi:hypothetical protein